MPLTPLEALSKIVENQVANAYTLQGQAPTLAALYNARRMSEKKDTSINWDVKMDGANSGRKAVTATATNTDQNAVVPANLRIGRYQLFARFDINRVNLTERKLLAPTELANDLAVTIDDALDEIFSDFNQLIYTGTGSVGDAEVGGLALFGSETLPYAGIDPAVNPLWKPVVLGNGGTPRALTPQLMRKVRTAMTKSRVGFNAITLHPDTAERYEDVWAEGNGGGFIKVSDGTDPAIPRVEMATGMRTFMGVPLLEDVDAPVGSLTFWDTTQMDVYSFRMDTGEDTHAMSQTERKLVTADTFGMVMHLAELPSGNSAVRSFEMYILPQLRLRNRRKLIRLTDLAM